MRDRDDAQWILVLARLLRAEHRQEIVGDLLEERRTRVARGELRVIASFWLASHLIRSAVAGWTGRGSLSWLDDSPRGGTWRRGFERDLRYSIRRLVRRPGVSLAAVLTLTIGIGLTAGMFGLVNAVVFKTPPIPAIDRVVTVHPADRPAGSPNDMEFAQFEALADLDVDGIASLGGTSYWFGAVAGPDRAELLTGETVSARYFDTLRLTPRAGTFAMADSERSPRQAVVISDRLWDRWFARDPRVIGRTLTVSGDPLTVVGVAPLGFGGVFVPTIRQADLWMPYAVTSRIDDRGSTSGGPQIGWSSSRVRVLARLRDNSSLAAVAAAFGSVGTRIDPRAFSGQSMLTASPVRRSLVPPDLDALATGFGAGFSALAALVLLIACSNLANLLLADVLGRRSEFAIRVTSGATRAHLVRSVLTETLVLTVMGLIGGLGVAIVLARALASVSHSVPLVPTLQIDTSPDWRIFAFSGAVALVAGVGIGAGPAWRASRSSSAGLLQSGASGHYRGWKTTGVAGDGASSGVHGAADRGGPLRAKRA